MQRSNHGSFRSQRKTLAQSFCTSWGYECKNSRLNTSKPVWYANVVNDHIRTFFAERSHYSRAKNPHRRYIVSDQVSSFKDCHRLFVDLHSDGVVELASVKYQYYHNEFVTKHNLAFGKPASDTCTLCDKHEAQNTVGSAQYVRHKLFKKMARGF